MIVIKYNVFKGLCISPHCALMDKPLPSGICCVHLVSESNNPGWDQDLSLPCFRWVLCLLSEATRNSTTKHTTSYCLQLLFILKEKYSNAVLPWYFWLLDYLKYPLSQFSYRQNWQRSWDNCGGCLNLKHERRSRYKSSQSSEITRLLFSWCSWGYKWIEVLRVNVFL